MNASTNDSHIDRNEWHSTNPPPVDSRSRRSLSSSSSVEEDIQDDSMLSPGTSQQRGRRRHGASGERQEKDASQDPRSRVATAGDGSLLPYPPSDGSASADLEMNNMSEAEFTDDEETGLTGGKRKKRRRRTVGEDPHAANNMDTSKEESKLADMNVIRRSAVNVVLIGLWQVGLATLAYNY